MVLVKRPFLVLLFALVISSAFRAWSQTEQSNADKLQLLQKQLDLLKAQMEGIQAQITDLSKASRPSNAVLVAPTSAGATAAEPAKESGAVQASELGIAPKRQVGQTTASRQTNSQDEIAAPRIDNAPLDPRYPGYFRLPGTQTLLRIGGYFKTDFIYDLKPAGDPDRFIPSTFPIPAPPSGVNNNTVSIRPTRLNLDFLIPVNSKSVRFFMEFDLFGSNSTTPRLRHAYAQVANFLVGQSFSNFMDPDAGPDTLEFQGPVSQVSIRNPQVRYSIPLAEKTSLSLAIEKASSDLSFTTPQFNSLPNSPSPDGTIKFRHEFTGGHVQLSSVFRTPGAYLPAPSNKSDSVVGWGINLSGAFKTIGKDTFVYQGAYGAGYERYVNDTSGLGIDAAPKDANHLKALPLTATYGAYQHYWVKQLRSSVVYGFAQVDNTEPEPGDTYHQSNYSAANLIWNPFGSLNVGTEILYGWITEKDKAKANDTRFMFSAKYNFVKTGETKK